ncbi:uncharacterized protein LOC115701201 [Cannabis sativa]|uniref:Uncharacterized protein n=1 Tax=Cannabis sativa TaxID=3483 RepID=A0A7J6HIC4_CANSA|nr:uncharacterized protein LOC115701201 [Cannabis sativa]KAF4394329.1 hypothetical protein G4B88_018479 [Cannabis sativa]
MGCCLSSSTKSTQREELKQPDAPPVNHQHFRRTTPALEMEQAHIMSPHPPPVVEEESVKEVLSETPVSKPPTPNPETFTEKKKSHLMTTATAAAAKDEKEPEVVEVSEASYLSETCEVSESYSYLSTTTTTTITEVRDEDEAISKRKREVGPRITNGSTATTRRKRPNCGAELSGRRGRGPVSSGNRPERSAEKKNRVDNKSIRGRESGQGRTIQRNDGYAGIRRDIGEVSSRRSRSPAPRTTGGVSRGGLSRNSSKGTGRGGCKSLGGDSKEKSQSESNTNNNDVGSSQLGNNNESLENPLVSLECFIFV